MATALSQYLSIAVDDGIELRPLRLADADAIYFLVATNRDRLGEWLPWVPSIGSPADEAAFIRGSHESLAAGTGLPCAIVVDRAVAGTLGAMIDPSNRSAEIGYWIADGYEGRGIVTRAARAMTTFLLGDLDLHRVVIRAATGNTRSRAIPERLGFVHEGTQRHAEILHGEFFDLEVYSTLAPDWGAFGP
ncbi:MAG: GNAT family protein [Chloroflexi bacterium]|nr:GNAT family protein [Chloroflexota bacterium]MDA1148325.1 GNAT family protein [Chloroflexota bacterium]